MRFSRQGFDCLGHSKQARFMLDTLEVKAVADNATILSTMPSSVKSVETMYGVRVHGRRSGVLEINRHAPEQSMIKEQDTQKENKK